MIFVGNATVENLSGTIVQKNVTSQDSQINITRDSKTNLDNENFTTEYFFMSTTKEPLEICEINSTCNASDLLVNSTDSELLLTNITEKIPVIQNNSPTFQQFCTCDLMVGNFLYSKEINFAAPAQNF